MQICNIACPLFARFRAVYSSQNERNLHIPQVNAVYQDHNIRNTSAQVLLSTRATHVARHATRVMFIFFSALPLLFIFFFISVGYISTVQFRLFPFLEKDFFLLMDQLLSFYFILLILVAPSLLWDFRFLPLISSPIFLSQNDYPAQL